MNVARLKFLIWLVAIAVGGLLSWSVTDFLMKRRELEQGIPQEVQRAVLDGVDEGEEVGELDLVDYKQVRETFHTLNWTGKAPPKPVEKVAQDTPEVPVVQPIADILDVLLVQVDVGSEEGSRASVRYKDTPAANAARSRARVRRPESNTEVLSVGSPLRVPWESVTVSAIRSDGVEFSFEDESREPELVEPLTFPPDTVTIFKVPTGEKAFIPDQGPSLISRAEDPLVKWVAKRTNRIGKNDFRLGTLDVQEVEQNYSQILSRDVRYARERDPQTGNVIGLRVTHVAPNSIPASHGLVEGEVVKSINGHPVTSLQSAIAYVKNEAATTDRWVVVIERQGREYTRVYHSPAE